MNVVGSVVRCRVLSPLLVRCAGQDGGTGTCSVFRQMDSLALPGKSMKLLYRSVRGPKAECSGHPNSVQKRKYEGGGQPENGRKNAPVSGQNQSVKTVDEIVAPACQNDRSFEDPF